MGEVKTKEKAFILPEDGSVTVKFIRKNKGLSATVDENHVISGGLLEGSTRKFCVAPLKGGGLKNVLTKAEKDYFESGPYRGVDLSIYSTFWDDFYVSIGKTDTILRWSNPLDYLRYKVLLGWDQVVAPSLTEYKRNKRATYQFILIKEGEERQESSKALSATKKAWKMYAKIENNKDILISIVSLLEGKKLANSSTIDFLREEVERIVDDRPKDFANLVEDANFEVKSLIALAEHAGVVVKRSGKYETADGLSLAHKGSLATLTNAVKFLNDPKNQEVKDLITARLQTTKE